MSSQEPICSTCKKTMRGDSPFIDYETKPGLTGLGRPFPSNVEMKMFENYFCPKCGNRLRQLVQVAVYENPRIEKLL